MRDVLKPSSRWLGDGWFWPLVLLALPGCTNDYGDFTTVPGPAFDPGSMPTSAVICDIPFPQDGVKCGDPMSVGMASGHGAVALNLGESSFVVLDFSPAAVALCGNGEPRRLEFVDTFPQGTTVCLNCEEKIPGTYANPAAVCIEKCKDLLSAKFLNTPTGTFDVLCQNARVSTNFDPTKCVDNICTNGGNPTGADSRVNPEDVVWGQFLNTNVPPAAGTTLSFPGPGDPTHNNFNGGAASDDPLVITTGDAWVEFHAGETDVSHVVGLRTSCDKVANCPDDDGTLADIDVAISLNYDNQVFVIEDGGNTVIGPLLGGAQYTPNDLFRIHVTDKHNGTAEISYSKVTGSCTPGFFCLETPITTHIGAGAYPLRVDASFREGPASVKDVKIMRIKFPW